MQGDAKVLFCQWRIWLLISRPVRFIKLEKGPGDRKPKMPDRILVIEDDEPTRYAYERALSRAGYRTHGYASYFDAAEEIDKGAGALLVVDLQLPPSTPHGLAVARMARQHRPGLPIIFVTGYHELATLTDPEMGPVMLKPFELDLLVSTVRERLQRHKQALASAPI
jgi:DNA-binding NtrC family response regulator